MRQRVRADNLTICYRKKQTDISLSCVCPVIDNEFRHNIVKVFCADPVGYGLVDPQLLWQCHDEIRDQKQERRQFVKQCKPESSPKRKVRQPYSEAKEKFINTFSSRKR